jgi:exopolyphosphatase/pppGpp-phosphohydrolase
MVGKLQPPIGWEPEDFRLAVLVVRYHRGSLPAPGEKDLQDLTEEQRQLATTLAGILRLAVTFVSSHRADIPSLDIRRSGQAVVIAASGYDKYDRLAQKLARARYLLEIACGLPVIIQNS